MKTAVALGAAFVAVLALIARSADREAAGVSGSGPTASVAAAPVAAEVPARSAVAVESPRPATSAAPAPAGIRATAQAPTPAVLTARLDGVLGLNPIQRGRIEEILRARELEVGAMQKRVLESGYFNPRETDPRLASLREDSYVQISMLLDVQQNRRFAEALRTNSINDHMVISLPDSLVLLD